MAERLLYMGYILKKEKLASLESSVIRNEMVLESLDPYPGFYDQYYVPVSDRDVKLGSFFLVTKDMDFCHEDEFVRANTHIKEKYQLDFDAALSTIQLMNQTVKAIRVNINELGKLGSLVGHYKEAGISLQAYRSIKAYQSLIKVRRYIDLEVLDEGIYRDVDKSDLYFVHIPEFLTWDEFEQITISVRNNWENKIYDAAQAATYTKKGIMEMVRIYDRNASIEKLQYLRQRYTLESSRR